ncbi:MAG: non-canonical purine NTP pyrophosphatase, RdgB/HAM1 family [Gammaproteobacteria bacterium]|nr:MAG: non-canonical purine NTP pyrophosphatase, RdgB/HAM1 family [Gammaproteobacteria bacterium]
MQTVVLASGNRGKIGEIQSILQPLAWKVVPQNDFQVEEAEETGLSFVENAIIKARNAAVHCNLPAIADDSGLEVDALNGEPGIYSSRFAGVGATDQQNLEKLLEQLDSVDEPQRTARFRCVMVFMRHAKDPSPVIAEGSWEGKILTSPSGDSGFGYDPVFWVPERDCSAAQLSKLDKNSLSHRGKALKALLPQLT